MPDVVTADNVAYLYGDITKVDDEKHLVEGYVSSEAVDLAGQIVDPEFLKRAIPPWLASWANVREGHDPRRPVGVAKSADLTAQPGPYVVTEVVDSEAWKKVKAGLLKGYSVGIKDPKVVYDSKAPNGRIVDGIFLELSLVDRPCNPDAKVALYKAASTGFGWEDVQRGVVVEPPPLEPAADPSEAIARPVGRAAPAAANAETAALKAAVLQAQAEQGSVAAQLVLAGGDFSMNPVTGQVTGVVVPDVAKREYSAEERRQLASSGAALPDGTFPITDRASLEDAAKRAHQGSDPAAARAHIRKRAKELGLEVPPSDEKNAAATAPAREAPDLAKAAKHPMHHGAHSGIHNHYHEAGYGEVHTHDHIHFNDDIHDHPHSLEHGNDARIQQQEANKAAADFSDAYRAPAVAGVAAQLAAVETQFKELRGKLEALANQTDKDRDGDVDTAANSGPNGTGDCGTPASDFAENAGTPGLIAHDSLPLTLKSAVLDSPEVIAAIDRIIAARVGEAVKSATRTFAQKQDVTETLGTTADVAKSAAAVARGLEAIAFQLEATSRTAADATKAAEATQRRLEQVEKMAAPVKGLGSQAVAVDKVIGLDTNPGAAARVAGVAAHSPMAFDELVEKAATLNPDARSALAQELYKIILASPAQSR